MNIFSLLINDPLALYSFGGLAILFGICGYYVHYFLKSIREDS